MLSDRDLLECLRSGELEVDGEGWDIKSQVQPASIDLRLGGVDKPMHADWGPHNNTVWNLYPGDFVLGYTEETVGFPATLAGRVEGKSTWGRLGLLVHMAGFIDPGFRGQLTLEFKNLSDKVIVIGQRDPICQMSVTRLSTMAVRPYGTYELGSHYQGQIGVTESWRS